MGPPQQRPEGADEEERADGRQPTQGGSHASKWQPAANECKVLHGPAAVQPEGSAPPLLTCTLLPEPRAHRRMRVCSVSSLVLLLSSSLSAAGRPWEVGSGESAAMRQASQQCGRRRRAFPWQLALVSLCKCSAV